MKCIAGRRLEWRGAVFASLVRVWEGVFAASQAVEGQVQLEGT